MNLALDLVSTASSQPDSIADRIGETATTYGELDRLSAWVAGPLLERGLMPGERVGVMLPDVAESTAEIARLAAAYLTGAAA